MATNFKSQITKNYVAAEDSKFEIIDVGNSGTAALTIDNRNIIKIGSNYGLTVEASGATSVSDSDATRNGAIIYNPHGAIQIRAAASTTAIDGLAKGLTLSGGYAQTATNKNGGQVNISGGTADGSGTGGNFFLSGGSTGSGTPGRVYVLDGKDRTKGVNIITGNMTTGIIRDVTLPDKNGTLAMLSDTENKLDKNSLFDDAASGVIIDLQTLQLIDDAGTGITVPTLPPWSGDAGTGIAGVATVIYGIAEALSSNYAKLNTTNTFNGDVVINTGASEGSLRIRTNPGIAKNVKFQSSVGSTSRWDVGVSGVAESGSNAGSDFVINRFNDAGTYIDSPLTINRATGVMTAKSIGLNQSALPKVTFETTTGDGKWSVGCVENINGFTDFGLFDEVNNAFVLRSEGELGSSPFDVTLQPSRMDYFASVRINAPRDVVATAAEIIWLNAPQVLINSQPVLVNGSSGIRLEGVLGLKAPVGGFTGGAFVFDVLESNAFDVHVNDHATIELAASGGDWPSSTIKISVRVRILVSGKTMTMSGMQGVGNTTFNMASGKTNVVEITYWGDPGNVTYTVFAQA